MKNEEWRDVVGYEGLYQVSSEGRVKSLKRKDKEDLPIAPSQMLLTENVSKRTGLSGNIF